MIKENKTFIRWSHPYFKQNIDRLPDRTVRKKRYNHIRSNYRIFDERYIAQKKKKKLNDERYIVLFF